MGRFWDKFTGTEYPDSGVVPLSAAEVRSALLALNGAETPFRVRNALPAEKADLVAERRIKEVGVTLKTRMRLDPKNREVRTLTERWEASSPDHSGGRYGRGQMITVYRQWEYERGPDGRRRKVETFRFDTRDMRMPLLKTVLSAGWTWRGVLFRW
ncbi:hypothetical protein [Streptomyces ipomoeae]|uniref:hypothetical protein n=1 Tax=Streptomyces ipomoeae TaxID=103232 RepID=UPI00114708AD|nr:hypothetical protein [Streptomyces ipomoeae]MDX2933168.1 hypothetical protein [Streptomyces ipomoeae]TQE19839.1 hypothetical protein SipoB123_30800 [Streptomyces ipomoeae]